MLVIITSDLDNANEVANYLEAQGLDTEVDGIATDIFGVWTGPHSEDRGISDEWPGPFVAREGWDDGEDVPFYPRGPGAVQSSGLFFYGSLR